ncbi:ANTAR domain-containing protein [Mycobacterium deserti]|uniref:ANTAR domain-containing protein n=1 Tax=Mycobacterium deserti TaxID=2978347 RepID=A0ABT2M5C9_9MYCO|nr:ANTAR domain-containing protein [Mycobacterium deserti]MCT7657471.1 ANTAR domain-containing protein [Mycobacterium deserti]
MTSELSTAVIDQARGMLMLVYEMDDESALQKLCWRAEQTNTTLRAVAEQLVIDFVALSAATMPPRSVFDKMFDTLHHRIL